MGKRKEGLYMWNGVQKWIKCRFQLTVNWKLTTIVCLSMIKSLSLLFLFFTGCVWMRRLYNWMTVSICSQVTNSSAKRQHHRTPSHTHQSVNIFLTCFDSALSDADETGCFSEETVQRCGLSVMQSLLRLITVCVPLLEAEILEAESLLETVSAFHRHALKQTRARTRL